MQHGCNTTASCRGWSCGLHGLAGWKADSGRQQAVPLNRRHGAPLPPGQGCAVWGCPGTSAPCAGSREPASKSHSMRVQLCLAAFSRSRVCVQRHGRRLTAAAEEGSLACDQLTPVAGPCSLVAVTSWGLLERMSDRISPCSASNRRRPTSDREMTEQRLAYEAWALWAAARHGGHSSLATQPWTPASLLPSPLCTWTVARSVSGLNTLLSAVSRPRQRAARSCTDAQISLCRCRCWISACLSCRRQPRCIG